MGAMLEKGVWAGCGKEKALPGYCVEAGQIPFSAEVALYIFAGPPLGLKDGRQLARQRLSELVE